MTPRLSSEPLHVAITVPFPESFLDRVRAADPRVVLHYDPAPELAPLSAAAPEALLAQAEVMYTCSVLPGAGQAPRLRWAQLDTSGIDHVRGSGLWSSDTVITTLGGISPAPLAEWILMMVLAHAHHLRESERLAAAGDWPSREYRWEALMPRNLRGATLGIVGYGRIGKEVARLARAFGMRVAALRRGSPSGGGAQFGSAGQVAGVTELGPGELPRLLRASDYVVLTVPLTPATEHLIGAAQLALMKPGAVLINASRGGVVDEDALLDCLEAGHLDLVASDVFEQEPLPADHPFWTHPRFVVTPHVAGFAPDYLESTGTLFTANIRRYLAGDPLLNVADRERGY